MDSKQAIKEIVELMGDSNYTDVWSGASSEPMNMALDLAIEALEKQMPAIPIFEDNGSVEYNETWIECPMCGESVPEYIAENETECYCLGCGQKLKWENEF